MYYAPIWAILKKYRNKFFLRCSLARKFWSINQWLGPGYIRYGVEVLVIFGTSGSILQGAHLFIGVMKNLSPTAQAGFYGFCWALEDGIIILPLGMITGRLFTPVVAINNFGTLFSSKSPQVGSSGAHVFHVWLNASKYTKSIGELRSPL